MFRMGFQGFTPASVVLNTIFVLQFVLPKGLSSFKKFLIAYQVNFKLPRSTFVPLHPIDAILEVVFSTSLAPRKFLLCPVKAQKLTSSIGMKLASRQRAQACAKHKVFHDNISIHYVVAVN